MVRNQDVVKKAQAEIDRVVGQVRLPTLEDRDRLPYIECILKETLRYVSSLTSIHKRLFSSNFQMESSWPSL